MKCICFLFIIAPEKLTGNPCVSKETCGDCITADPECAWCSQEVILFCTLCIFSYAIFLALQSVGSNHANSYKHACFKL